MLRVVLCALLVCVALHFGVCPLTVQLVALACVLGMQLLPPRPVDPVPHETFSQDDESMDPPRQAALTHRVEAVTGEPCW